MAYVYGHYTADADELFYIGKGTANRAWSKRPRNKHWKSVVEKHGLVVKIMLDGLTDEEAYDKERQLIAEIGIHNLTNKTEGGEGLTSQALKQLFEDNPEIGIKISNALKGKPKTKEHIENISKGKKGKATTFGPHSEETKQKLSEARKNWFAKGNVAWNKGKKGVQQVSEETRQKLREAALRQHARNKQDDTTIS
jgi:hypothetical protein